jgi:hypothetical protein
MECHAPFWELKEGKLDFFCLSGMIGHIFRLVLIYIRLTVRYFQLEDHDAVIVGYNGYLDMPVAKLLTRIRGKPLIFTPVFRRFISIKMIIYPIIVLGLTLLLPLGRLSSDMAAGIKLALVIEAAVPPATNILITTKAYGSEDQVHFVGSGIMATYIAALITLPVFILLIMLWR